MPRADYDTSADVYTGPSAPMPNTFRFNVPCRLVYQSHYLVQQPSPMRMDFYANYSGLLTTAGSSSRIGGIITVNLNTADVWEVPPGSANFLTVFKTCIILPTRAGILPYRRVYFAV